MKALEIDLIFRKSDFEELFFRNGNEKLFFSPTAKNQTHVSIIAGIIFFLSVLNFIIFHNSQELVLFFFVLWCVSLIPLGEKIYAILKWRKSIKVFLEKTAKYKVNKIILTENTFSIIQDDEEIIQKWSDFKKVEINLEFVRLYSDIHYLFPSKSMTSEEFNLFKEKVSEEIKTAYNSRHD